MQQSLHLIEGVLIKPHPVNVQRKLLFVEQTHHDVLTGHGGHGGDADVDLLALGKHLDAPVLRHTPLGDVHARHNLDARYHGRVEVGLRGHDFLKRAVDAVPDACDLGLRLEVNVARPLFDAIEQNQIDEVDDARAFGQLLHHSQVFVRVLGRHDLDVGLSQALQEVPHLDGFAVIGLEGLLNVLGPALDRLHGVAREPFNVVDGEDAGRIIHRQHEVFLLHEEHRHHPVVLGLLFRQQIDRFGIDEAFPQPDVRDAHLPRDSAHDLVLGGEAHFDQNLAQSAPGLPLPLERFLQQLGQQLITLNQDLAEPFSSRPAHNKLFTAASTSSNTSIISRTRVAVKMSLHTSLGEAIRA